MGKTYLYLLKKDRSDIKILAVLQGQYSGRLTLETVKAMGIAAAVEDKLENVFHSHAGWELWAEAAESYADLEKQLHKRGIRVHSSGIPLCSSQIESCYLPKTTEKKTVSMIRRP